MSLTVALTLLAALGQSPAATEKVSEPATLTLAGVMATRIPGPEDAVMMAAADARLRPPGPGFYVFLPMPSRESIAAQAYAANCSLSHAAHPLSPEVLFGGSLLYFDLARWCPDATSLARVLKTLNGYEDRYFYVRGQVLKTVAPYIASDGKTYTTRLEQGVAFGPHIDQAAAAELIQHTGHNTPIVYGPAWLGGSLRTLEGGIYYKLRGYDQTDQKQWLALFGASEAASEALRGNAFAGRLGSNVAGKKPRRAVVFFGIATNPTYGYPLVSLTQDIFDEDVTPDTDPIYSLLDFKFRATEIIASLPNGFPAAFLANDKGERQDSVPENVAKDHTVPDPHTARLEPLIACGRCHGPDDFYKPFPNNVKRLLSLERAPGQRLDVFGDLTEADQHQAIEKIAGKYKGDFEDAFILARDAAERAAFRATGMGVEDCWAIISSEWQAHHYDSVTAFQACLELGWLLPVDTSPEQAAKFFRELVPVLPGNAYGVSPENPYIASLCDWVKEHEKVSERLDVGRRQWERIYRDAALRAKDAHPLPLKGTPP